MLVPILLLLIITMQTTPHFGLPAPTMTVVAAICLAVAVIIVAFGGHISIG